MQLLLTMPELQLLADLLEQKRYAITHSAQPVTDRERTLARDYEELLGRVIERDIRFSADELVTLNDMLTECDREMKPGDDRRQRLETMMDKFVEVCAMF